MQSAPAASYCLAISRYGKFSAMTPFEGEAFLHSHIKAISSFLSAFSKAKLPSGIARAADFTSSADLTALAFSTLILA